MDTDTRRRAITAVLVTAVALLLLLGVWVSSAGPTLDWSPNDGNTEPTPSRAETPEQGPSEDLCADDDCEPSEGPFATIAVGVVLVVGVLLLLAVIALFRSRPSLLARSRGRSLGAPGEPLPDVAEAVRDDAEQQHEALRTGAPRNAIVACWVRLEDAVVSSGLSVRGSETSTELTERVLAAYVLDDSAITRLAALYREARFSRHEITEEMRREAVGRLEQLHDDIASPTTSGGASR